MFKISHILSFVAATALLAAAGCSTTTPQAVTPTPQMDQVTESSQLMATSTTSTARAAQVESATSTAEFLSSSSAGLNPEDSRSGEDQCISLGGKLISLSAPTGAWQACYFTDKSLCEIQSLRLGDCHPGACHEVCLNGHTTSEGIYDSCSGWLIRKAHCAK